MDLPVSDRGGLKPSIYFHRKQDVRCIKRMVMTAMLSSNKASSYATGNTASDK